MDLRVVIVGAGRSGLRLAQQISRRHQVLLVDNDPGSLDPQAQQLPLGQDPVALSPEAGLWAVAADGTSRIVLSKMYDEQLSCALVAMTGSDDYNLEVGRLAKGLGFDPVIAILHHSECAENYRAEGITPIDRAQLLAGQIEQSLRHQGAVLPSGIGLGRGELIEIRLLRTSPMLNMPLKNLAPQSWRVAAVFREDDLIVPTGDTVLQVNDRVLLVGSPDVLPAVAEYLHQGLPQFPMPFGPNVVTLERSGPDAALLAEAEYLATTCAATGLVRGIPGASPSGASSAAREAATLNSGNAPEHQATFPLPDLGDPELSERLPHHRPGVLVTRPMARGWLARLPGLRADDTRLTDLALKPLLFARGTYPYGRLLLPISGSTLDIAAAEVAVDLVRQTGASLSVINVDLPRYISGTPPERLHDEVVPVRRLLELYDVPLEYHHQEGNPIQHVLADARGHDLMIVARRKGRADTFSDPDVALRLARKAPCSVLVVTVPRER